MHKLVIGAALAVVMASAPGFATDKRRGDGLPAASWGDRHWRDHQGDRSSGSLLYDNHRPSGSLLYGNSRPSGSLLYGAPGQRR